jgi:hypothetical protein
MGGWPRLSQPVIFVPFSIDIGVIFVNFHYHPCYYLNLRISASQD